MILRTINSIRPPAYPLFFLSFFLTVSWPSAFAQSEPAAEVESQPAENLKKAKVFNFGGDVRILKKEAGKWFPAEKNMEINAGDQVLTSKEGFVDVVYDPYFLNITHINENTKVEFKTIEPAEIFLEDGSAFSVLDGLKPGEKYQILTPKALAVAKGARFEVSYEASGGRFSVWTFKGGEGRRSRVLVQDVGPGQKDSKLTLKEGKQMAVEADQTLKPGLVRELDPKKLASAQRIFEHFFSAEIDFEKLRGEGKQILAALPLPPDAEEEEEKEEEIKLPEPALEEPKKVAEPIEIEPESEYEEAIAKSIEAAQRQNQMKQEKAGLQPDYEEAYEEAIAESIEKAQLQNQIEKEFEEELKKKEAAKLEPASPAVPVVTEALEETDLKSEYDEAIAESIEESQRLHQIQQEFEKELKKQKELKSVQRPLVMPPGPKPLEENLNLDYEEAIAKSIKAAQLQASPVFSAPKPVSSAVKPALEFKPVENVEPMVEMETAPEPIEKNYSQKKYMSHSTEDLTYIGDDPPEDSAQSSDAQNWVRDMIRKNKS